MTTTMKKSEALAKLKALGTAQNRKTYARHGVTREMFGVSYANLGKLVKALKVDHALALELWQSGNHDARVLATMIADPAAIDAKTLDAWAKELDSYVLTDAFSKLAARSPLGTKRAEAWVRSKDEWIASAGWSVVSQLANPEGGLSEAFREGCLKTIEANIHKAKNRVRYSMNNALIAIGAWDPKLRKLALASAARIGKLEVDHGETGCKTPDASSYIAKMVEYHEQKAAKKAPARKTARKPIAKKATAEKAARGRSR